MTIRTAFTILLMLLLASPGWPQTSVCGDIPTFDSGIAPMREIHVAVNGSNVTGDGSREHPYATIAFAARRAAPGDAVRVHPGEYAGGVYIENLRGQAVAPIWIGGLPGEPRPVIRGGSQGLHIVRARYVVVHDIEVVGAAANGVNCDDGGDVTNPEAARFIVFRRLSIRDIGGTGNQDGLKLSGIRDFVVVDCDFARCGGAASGSGIDMVGCHRGLIARCRFEDMSGKAVQIKGGSADVEVRWCRMVNAGERAVNIGGSTGFAYFRPPLSQVAPNAEAWRIRVLANVIEGSNAAVAFVGCVDSVVAHNTIITPRRWIFRILQETVSSGGHEFLACGNNVFEGNLVYFSRGLLSTHVNIGPNTAAPSFTFAHNLWYAYDNPASSAPSLPSPEVNAIIGRDPRLIDPGNGDYRLHLDSPGSAAGRGRSQAPGPAVGRGDHGGVCYAEPPSIGAFEIITCPADCDRSTGPRVLDVFDFLCFGTRFAAGERYACECDESTGKNVCDAFDFLCFQNAFAAGCS